MANKNEDLLSQFEFLRAVKRALKECGGKALDLSHRLHRGGVSVDPVRIGLWIKGRSPSFPLSIKVFGVIGNWDKLRHMRQPKNLAKLCRREFQTTLLKSLKAVNDDTQAMAGILDVDRRSVQFWVKGASLPYWRMQDLYKKLNS